MPLIPVIPDVCCDTHQDRCEDVPCCPACPSKFLTMAAFVPDALAYLDVKTRQKALRAMPYRDYLKTDHWQATKKQAIAGAGYQCQRCGQKYEPHERWNFNVHHRTYENRGAELDEDLEVLCRACHAREHGH